VSRHVVGCAKTAHLVIPAKAGIHFFSSAKIKMDPGFRRDDEHQTV
jgi:hypothetical protein